MWRFAYILLIVVLAISCASESETLLDTDGDWFEEALLDTINKYRIENELDTLLFDEYASILARDHSKNMATHYVSFGFTYQDVRFGYLREAYGQHIELAEVICRGALNPTDVVEMWERIPEFIERVKGDYNRAGIGAYRSMSEGMFGTVILIKDTVAN